jgi:hypothetical protein
LRRFVAEGCGGVRGEGGGEAPQLVAVQRLLDESEAARRQLAARVDQLSAELRGAEEQIAHLQVLHELPGGSSP